MALHLERLAKGNKTTTLPTCSCDAIPKELNLDQFERGQNFFKRNMAACLFTMMCSLVVGLSVNNLLEPLVFTKQSDTPKKSLIRYLKTMAHVVHWHCGNVWDTTSKARKSIQKVCSYHDNTRIEMMKKSDFKFYVSQYDMSLVQAGFMGLIIMYPRQFGICATQSDLKDYVYFWKWIGYLLGIDDKNNICINSLKEAKEICHEIEDQIIYPALLKPPPHFSQMAEAFTNGLNLLHRFNLLTPEAVICFTLDLAKRERLNHSFIDIFRIMFMKLIVKMLYYSSVFRNLLNRSFEHLCKMVDENRF